MKYTLNRNTEGFILSVAHTQHDDVEIINLNEIDGKYLSCCKLNELTHMLEIDEAKKTEVDLAENQRKAQEEITELKQKLADTDYIYNVIKEGDATEEYYSEVISNRKLWRARIRELENI